jgi:small subunit ribosomal protein S3Ae
MAKKTARISSWKSKRFYTILAPEKFELKEIGTTLTSDPKSLAGRTVDVSLADLTKDRSKQHIKLVFEVHDVKGDKAYTRFKRFEIPVGYMRSKVRKGATKIDYLDTLALADAKVMVRVSVLSSRKISSTKVRDLNLEVRKILEKQGKGKLDEFVQQVIFGKVGTEIYRKLKKITPLSRVEVWEVRRL